MKSTEQTAEQRLRALGFTQDSPGRWLAPSDLRSLQHEPLKASDALAWAERLRRRPGHALVVGGMAVDLTAAPPVAKPAKALEPTTPRKRRQPNNPMTYQVARVKSGHR